MAEALRELVARVILRVDESTLKRLDTQIDAVKAGLTQVQAKANEGVSVKVDVQAADAERSLAGIRVALASMGDNVSSAALAKLRGDFDLASTAADALRFDIDQLKSADPKNPRIEELAKQLNRVESEARQTAAALDKTTESANRLPGILGKIQQSWGKLSGGLQTLGIGLGVAGLTAFVHGTLEAAGAVEDLADRLGVTTDEAQIWSAFTKQAGADSEALTASFKGLANAMQGAANGGKEQAAAFKALGISTDDWKKGLPSLTDTLTQVGGKLGELDNEGQRLALTQKLLSEGGLKLAPAFKGGTKAVEEHMAKLKELAVVYDEEFVKSAGEAGDELDMFYAQFRGLGAELILTFLPALRGAVRELTPLIRGFRDGFANSKIFTTGLIAAGATGLASFGGISGALARIAPMIGRAAAAAAPFIKGFLKFAAIALILDDFFVMLNGGKSVLGELLSKFELGRTTLDTFQNGFKLLKGSVFLLWGALSGDQGAIDKGKALLDEFSAWIDGFASNVGFMFNDLFGRVIPEAFTSGFNAVDEFLGGALSGITEFVSQWASELGGIVGGVWDAMIAGLKSMVAKAGDLLGAIPGYDALFGGDSSEEWQPISPSAQRAKAALDAGSPANPVLPAGNTASVVVNNNQQVNTTIGAGAPKEVVAAVRGVERSVDRTITKDNRKTIRHAVGAQR